MARHDNDPLIPHPQAGEPDQVVVTVIACLMILVVFIVIAALL